MRWRGAGRGRWAASLVVACALVAIAAVAVAPPVARADDPSPSPETIELPPITALAVGSQHACAIVQGGGVWCWGFSTDGGLGAGPDVTSSDAPVRALLPRAAVAITAGFEGTCAITDDGAAWCWGANGNGEVGDGTQEDRFEPTEVVGLGRPVVGISRGHDHACALLDDGSGWCWGDDMSGELGDGRSSGDALFQARPVRIAGVPRLAAVSAGASYTCALATDESAWCWGNQIGGVLGRGEDADSRTPGTVAGLDGGVDLLEAGDETTCAIRDGELLCWGLEGVTGTGESREAVVAWTPQSVDLDRPAVAVDSSNGYHVCALDADGMTWCWGDAEARQLGAAVPDDTVWVAEPVRMDLPAATGVATGYDFTCALLAPDDLRCWGDGDPVARNPWTGETGPPAGGFREPGPLVPTITTYIPTPRDVSTNPSVVGANLLLAAAVMVLFTIAGELLNRTLAGREDALIGGQGMLARLRAGRRRLDAAVERRLGRGRLVVGLRLAGIAAIYGLVFSLLDRTWDPLSPTGAWLFLSMALAFGIVGIADDLACWTLARRWGAAADLDLRMGNLLIAVVSTAASRVAVLVPGVMIGTPEALEVRTETLDGRRRARLAGAGLGTLAVIGLAAWGITLGTSVAGPGLPEGAATLVAGVEAFLLVVFAVVVQNGFAQMLAFRGTPGGTLRTTHRWWWLLGLLAVSFLFWHTLVNPRGDLATALRETNVVAFMATALGFVVVAGAVWLASLPRRRRAPATPAAVAEAPGVAVAPGFAEGSAAADAPPAPGLPEASPVAAAAVPPAAAVSPEPALSTAGPAPAVPPVEAAVAGVAAVAVATATPPGTAPPTAPVSPLAPASAQPVAAAAVEMPTVVSGAAVPAVPVPLVPAVPQGGGAALAAPVVAFDVRAVDDRRLHGAVRIGLQPAGLILAGTWDTLRGQRILRRAGNLVALLLVLGLIGIVLLTTVPGFRFYRVPWLLPSAAAVVVGAALVVIAVRLWASRQRWTGEVRVPGGLVVGVRTALDRRPFLLAFFLLTPIGGAIYAGVVGPTVVRLRGPFDPERSAVVEVRLRCRDRDEAADLAAGVDGIRRAAGIATGGWS